jgi:hypothetical protein
MSEQKTCDVRHLLTSIKRIASIYSFDLCGFGCNYQVDSRCTYARLAAHDTNHVRTIESEKAR